MPTYEYYCKNCGHTFEFFTSIEYREMPCTTPCKKCGAFEVKRDISAVNFNVPEGGCGNSANGYNTYHGEAENFKAKSKGEPPPYPDEVLKYGKVPK